MSKKRSRPTIDLPEANVTGKKLPVIDGVTPDVVPLLLQAIKTQKKLFSVLSNAPNNYNSNDLSNRNNIYHSDKVVDPSDVLFSQLKNRFVSSERNHDPYEALLQTHSNQAIDACEHFLQQLESKSVSSGKKKKTIFPAKAINDRDGITSRMNTSNAPVSIACLNFLLDTIQDDSCTSVVRRSALHVLGKLLCSSPVCCDSMFSTAVRASQQLQAFLDSVGEANTTCTTTGASTSITTIDERAQMDRNHFRKMQQEAILLLENMLKIYPLEYPKIVVAIRYLREQKEILCEDIDQKDENTLPSLNVSWLGIPHVSHVDLRRIRDVAIQNGETECIRLAKMIQHMEHLFHILVPRFGLELDTHANSPIGSTSKLCFDQSVSNIHSCPESMWVEEDELDVEWEDGDCSNADDEYVEPDHCLAVERTLTILKTSGILLDRTLRLDMEDPQETRLPNVTKESSSQSSDVDHARKRLEKYIQKLSMHHLPRLNDWIYALQKTDVLTAQDTRQEGVSGSGPLLLLPESWRKKKNTVLSLLAATRADVATVMKSAAKLGIAIVTADRNGNELVTNQCIYPHQDSCSNDRFPADVSVDQTIQEGKMPLARSRNDVWGSIHLKRDRKRCLLNLKL